MGISDVEGAVDAGADAVGIIFAPSPRRVVVADARAIVRSVPPYVSVLGVFANPDPALVADVIDLGCVPQYSGDETPEFCDANSRGRYVKTLHFQRGVSHEPHEAQAAAARFPNADVMFDSRAGSQYGGTGTTFSWPLVEALARTRRIIVSGGLVPENVAACVASLRPFGVDVRSGVETNDVKDQAKMRAFVRAVREADEGRTVA